MDFAVLLGVPLYILGGMVGSAFYLPLRGVRHWAWESYWIIYALVAMIVFPWTIAACTTPALLSILLATPASVLLGCYLFGVMWGIGGLTFGIAIRYLGVGLGTALACGIIAAVGTLVPPIYSGQFGSLLSAASGIAMLCGVAVAIGGIFATGMAGMAKERELSEEQKKAAVAEFNFLKGLLVAIFCGVTSAGMFLGIRAGDVMEGIAVQSHAVAAASPWLGLPKMVVILAGIAERVLDGFFDRTGDARVAVVDGVAAAGALGDDFARDRGRFADAAPTRAAHQIHVDVVIVIHVGAGREYGREFFAGGKLHVVQKSLLLRRPVPAVLHGDLMPVGEHEFGDVEGIAERVFRDVGVRIAVHTAARIR